MGSGWVLAHLLSLYQRCCVCFFEILSDGIICRSKDGELVCLLDLVCQIIILNTGTENIIPDSQLSQHHVASLRSHHEIGSEQGELRPQSQGRQQAFT